ncbi:MAG TPA: winged helix-turn-helix domain-containing protein [Dongiaceae bacterium]|nr:winged helix-turn-helix domain-containing protein [Dongiaceae bacterium]
MAAAVLDDKQGLSFGPFRLVVGERLLTKAGIPVELGGRALDILIALVATPNEIVNKKHLMARVWADVVVDEGSLRFHMASLRKALGDGENGARYITTVPGRGYCFVAPLATAPAEPHETPAALAHFPHANLPARLGRMIGRDDDVVDISAQLNETRFVTIVGPGGVGKTTVAVAVAHHLAETFAGTVLFVDFGAISDPGLAVTAIPSLLGLEVRSDDPAPGLVQFFGGRRVLLILDTCEHLVEVIAEMAAAICAAAPAAHILATSREALRVEGEHVYRLDALAYPPETELATAASIQAFPATQLFVERAAASGARLTVNDAEAAIVSRICRKLDGVALAIELAARRVESYGLEQTAALLDQRLTQVWHGLRTAPARQKTLRATLDWSYELLTDVERTVLRRLAVFVGHFTLDAALEVVAGATIDRMTAFRSIDSLVEKSMVAARPIGAMMRYRLPDSTRDYALELNIDQAEMVELAGRHADYYRRWLEQTGSEWASLSTGAARAPHLAALNNVRAALEWCFGETGDAAIGIGVAVAAAPVLRTMGLLPESHRWSEQALQALDQESHGSSEEMQLRASLGLSLMYMQGHTDAAIGALNRSLAIAEARGDHLSEVRLLGPLYFYHLRSGEFKTCLHYARRSAQIAATLDDAAAGALAQTLLGISLTLRGDLAEARIAQDAALGAEKPQAGREIYFGFDHHSWAEIGRITALWLQGYPEQARSAVDQAFRDAEELQHPVWHAIVINALAAVMWIDGLDVAEQQLDRYIPQVETHSFAPYLHLARAFKSELAIRRGETATGVAALKVHLEQLHAARYELFTARLQIVLAGGLAACGRFAEALTLVDATAKLIEAQDYASYLPELLRVKGSVLLAAEEANGAAAERCFMQSLELSRQQGSRIWTLRTATDLASLWARQDRAAEARELLLPIFEQFTEGRETADLRAAAGILAKL